jgi:hypothetical protein
LLDGRSEQVAALGQRPEQLRSSRAERAADLGHALGDTLVAHENARPEGIQQLLSGDHTPGIFDEVTEEMKALVAKRPLDTGRVGEAALLQVETKAMEAENHPAVPCRHGELCLGA